MENKRRLIRIEVEDFLEIQPLNEVAKMFEGKAKDLSLIGVCFSSQVQWQKWQVLLIDYFLHNELDSVKLKVVVIWSEFIDSKNGYFCGGEIIEVEDKMQAKFANYYFQRLKQAL